LTIDFIGEYNLISVNDAPALKKSDVKISDPLTLFIPDFRSVLEWAQDQT
jgi:hypothetical protein